jgi:hypothetical protein
MFVMFTESSGFILIVHMLICVGYIENWCIGLHYLSHIAGKHPFACRYYLSRMGIQNGDPV